MLQASRVPEAPEFLFLTALLQCTSSAPYLHTRNCRYTSDAPPDRQRSMLPRLHTCSAAPELWSYASTPTQLYHTSRTPYTSVPSCRFSCIEAPELHVSKSPHRRTCKRVQSLELHSSYLYTLHPCSAPPALHTSMPPRLHIAIPTARLPKLHDVHVSMSTRLRCASRVPYLHASTSLRLYRASRPPELHSSILLHLHACSALPDLQTSILPHHYASRVAPEQSCRASEFPCRHTLHACNVPQRSRTPEFYVSLHLYRTSRPLYLHVFPSTRLKRFCNAPTLYASTSARPEPYTSRPP